MQENEKESNIQPLANLTESIERLEKLVLSSPTEIKNKNISKELKSIITEINTILLNGLNIINSGKKALLSPVKEHYWTYLSKNQIHSVNYINSNDKFKNTKDKDKGLTWIILTIADKECYSAINDLYNKGIDKRFYNLKSIIALKKNEILNLCKRIDAISIDKSYYSDQFKNQVDDYENYKKQTDEFQEYDVSPLQAIDKENNNNNIVSIFHPDPNLNKFYNNENINFDTTSKIYENNEGGGFTTLLADPDENGVNYFTLNYDNAHDDMINTENNNNNNQNKIENDNNINISNSANNNAINNNKNYKIIEHEKFQSCYKERFYFNEDLNQSHSLIKENNNNKNYLLQDSERPNKKKKLNLNPQRIPHFPMDNDYQIKKRENENFFTKKDTIVYKGKEVKVTNSVLYYLNCFYNKENYFKFKNIKTSLKPITLQNQNYQCYICKHPFNMILNIPTESVYWCSYYLRFVCKACINDKFSIIPHFILSKWSFKKFSISIKAKKLLENYYAKPTICFSEKSKLVKRNEPLKSALILKRQIHKIYDLMKCENMDKFVDETLGEYKYLVLRDQILSLRDLVEINDLTFIEKLENFFNKMKDHIFNCPICNYKGSTCLMCGKPEIIYAFNVNVFYCKKCNNIFHKDCIINQLHECIVND